MEKNQGKHLGDIFLVITGGPMVPVIMEPPVLIMEQPELVITKVNGFK